MHTRSLSVFAAARVLPFLIVGQAAMAEDWPFYRGPSYNGVTTEAGWAPWKGQANIAWSKELGTGASSFTAVGDKVFTTGNKNNQDHVYCLDANTGKEIWVYSYAAQFEERMFEGGTASTPTVYKDKVYNLSYDGKLQCLDINSGKLVWEKNLLRDFGGELSRWKYAGSPLAIGDRLIIDVGGKGNSTVALDTNTGNKIWGVGSDSAGYASPIPFKQGNAPAVMVFKGTRMVAHDFKTGKQLWGIPWKTSYDVNASSPVILEQNSFFISSGYNDGRGAVFNLTSGAPQKVWQNDDIKTKMSSCAAYKGYIYGVTEKKAQLMCMDQKTGNTVWSERKGGQFGTLIIADGKLVVLSDAGELSIAEATPAGYKELASSQILNGRCWVQPILANGRIYAKNNNGKMVCVKL
jgi:outer membrane protein assembly factor BamB